MKIPEFAKAIAGALASGLASAATAAATNPQGVTTSTGVASAIATVIGGLLTYWVPNAAKSGDLVVKLRLDFAKFVAYIVAALPDLVSKAAEAAIAPTPAEVPPATPAVGA